MDVIQNINEYISVSVAQTKENHIKILTGIRSVLIPVLVQSFLTDPYELEDEFGEELSYNRTCLFRYRFYIGSCRACGYVLTTVYFEPPGLVACTHMKTSGNFRHCPICGSVCTVS